MLVWVLVSVLLSDMSWCAVDASLCCWVMWQGGM
jgi:hypothetical protein